MYQDSNMLASIRKVEAAREENAKLDPRRMTAEEKDTLLKKFHPDYRAEQFTELRFGPNQGQKVPLELAELLEGESRILHETFDLTKPDYETDVLIIGGGAIPSIKGMLSARKMRKEEEICENLAARLEEEEVKEHLQ